jgi:hypothetical protein
VPGVFVFARGGWMAGGNWPPWIEEYVEDTEMEGFGGG